MSKKIKEIVRVKIKLEVITGLHIGSGEVFDVASIDGKVIRDANEVPYIPGSSLKGRTRALLERFYDKEKEALIDKYFGSKDNPFTVLYFEDLYPEKVKIEIKPENSIDRTTGRATNPRNFERIGKGSVFSGYVEIVVYEDADLCEAFKLLANGFRLLEILGLGRAVSRGYGRVSVKIEEIVRIRIEGDELKEIRLKGPMPLDKRVEVICSGKKTR